MRFKRFTFSLLSPLLGFHYGRNPVSGQRFLHIAPIPFFGIDFEFKPYMNETIGVATHSAKKGEVVEIQLLDPQIYQNLR